MNSDSYEESELKRKHKSIQYLKKLQSELPSKLESVVKKNNQMKISKKKSKSKIMSFDKPKNLKQKKISRVDDTQQ